MINNQISHLNIGNISCHKSVLHAKHILISLLFSSYVQHIIGS